MAPFLDVRGVKNRMNVYDEFEKMCKETVVDVFKVYVCSSILAHTHVFVFVYILSQHLAPARHIGLKLVVFWPNIVDM